MYSYITREEPYQKIQRSHKHGEKPLTATEILQSEALTHQEITSKFSVGTAIATILAVLKMRVLIISRYRMALLLDMVIPNIIAAIPILLGTGIAGSAAAAADNFQAKTGSANYVAYLIIGSNVLAITMDAFWFFGFWVRREQQTGTLESIFTTPTSHYLLLAGLSIYVLIRSLLVFVVSYTVGCLIFGVNPIAGDVLLAVLFVFIGMIPNFGLAFLYGSLILRIKDAGSLINMMQWIFAAVMGIWAPIAIYPPLAQVVCLLIPGTWSLNAARAALLDVGYFFQTWYFDMAVIGLFVLLAPILGYSVWRYVDRGLRRGSGIGTF